MLPMDCGCRTAYQDCPSYQMLQVTFSCQQPFPIRKLPSRIHESILTRIARQSIMEPEDGYVQVNSFSKSKYPLGGAGGKRLFREPESNSRTQSEHGFFQFQEVIRHAGHVPLVLLFVLA